MEYRVTTKNELETIEIAQNFESEKFPNMIICLDGELGSGKTVEVKLNKIATMACKAAVKANDCLTQIEMEKLISDLRYIDNPFNCPHGRPIIIKFTEYELDKKFRRIVQKGL